MTNKDGDYEVILRPYFTTKNGRRIYARWYGKKAFTFLVKKKP